MAHRSATAGSMPKTAGCAAKRMTASWLGLGLGLGLGLELGLGLGLAVAVALAPALTCIAAHSFGLRAWFG